MNKIYHIICTIIFLASFLNAGAQDSLIVSPPVETGDSVYEPSVSNNYQFKRANGADKVDVRKVPDADLNKLKSDDNYWYINEVPRREKKDSEPIKKPVNLFDRPWIKTLFWVVLIGGFIALLVWFLATSNISLFRKNRKLEADKSTIEEETENIFELNFEREI